MIVLRTLLIYYVGERTVRFIALTAVLDRCAYALHTLFVFHPPEDFGFVGGHP